MPLSEDLLRIAGAAGHYAERGEELSGVLAVEPTEGERVYLCAFDAEERRSWLALDSSGSPVETRTRVRESVSILAMCELAEDSAVGGDLDELKSRLVALRLREAPPGIDRAEEAVDELQRAIGSPPRVASPARLDRVGEATRRLEQALGEGGSPFAEAMKAGVGSIEALTDEVEANYKLALV